MTVVVEPTTTPLVFRGAARFAAATVITVGGLLQLVGFLLEPGTQSHNADRVAWWVEHPGRIEAAQAVGFPATAFLIGGFAVLVALSYRTSRRISMVAAAALASGMTGLAAVTGIEMAARGALVSGSRTTAVRILDAKGWGAPLGVVLVMFLLGVLVGLVALSVATWRSPYVPRVVPVLLIAFFALDYVVSTPIISHLVLLVADGVVAWAVVTGYARTGDREGGGAAD